ncbi:MAG: hypothetical protein MZV63_13760 [Marinilabiliales bacterium]|nr:hypothetical protein [Marinilabiliales bacterium]
MEFVSHKIPYKFFDIKSNASLFYFPSQNKLFTHTSFLTDSLTTNLSIYSIDYPPAEFIPETVNFEGRKNPGLIILAIVLAVLSSFVTIYIIRKRRSGRILKDEIVTGTMILDEECKKPAPDEPMEKPNYQLILFGGFQVFNQKNEDITNKFSPLLKELFLLILLYTYKNNKGITSDQISEYLWFGKSTPSARNNRAVNIAKLKGNFS